ncbi:Uncharacterised protein [Streptococcus agalactiae]|nr:Uncharacterised protein [Streptococcus agalactiae]
MPGSFGVSDCEWCEVRPHPARHSAAVQAMPRENRSNVLTVAPVSSSRPGRADCLLGPQQCVCGFPSRPNEPQPQVAVTSVHARERVLRSLSRYWLSLRDARPKWRNRSGSADIVKCPFRANNNGARL